MRNYRAALKFFVCWILSRLKQCRLFYQAYCLISVLSAALFGLSPITGYGQNPFIHYSTSDGLPGNYTKTIESDAEGFVWAGTSEGLARFDGDKFVPFNDLQVSTPLPQGEIQTLLADSHGSLWVLIGSGGLYKINLRDYTVEAFELEFLQGLNAMVYTLFDLLEDEAGDIWFPARNGLAKYHYATGKFKLYPIELENIERQPFNICLGQRQDIWISLNEHLLRYDRKSGKYEIIQKFGANFYFGNLRYDSNGTLWINSWYQSAGGFFQYDPRRKEVLQSYTAKRNIPYRLGSTDIWGMFADGDTIWLATNNDGVFAFDKRSRQFYHYKYDGREENLSAAQVFCVTKDKFGNLWAGTSRSAEQLPKLGKAISIIRHKPDDANGLIGGFVFCAAQVSDSLMVFGTLTGLSIYNRIRKKFTNVRLPEYNENNYNNNILCAVEADAQSFWVGTWSGMFRLHKQTGKILEYYITMVNAGTKHPRAALKQKAGAPLFLHKDQKNDIWAISNASKLRKFSPRSGQQKFDYFEDLPPDQAALIEQVYYIMDYGPENLLFATNHGLVEYDRSKNTFRSIPLHFPSDSKAYGPIEFLSWSGTGALLAIIDGKAYTIHLSGHQNTVRPIESDYPLEKCHSILEDALGDYWLYTEKGLVHVQPKLGKSNFYDPKNYLLGNNFSPKNAGEYIWSAMDLDGNLYFPGNVGVTVINPRGIKFNPYPPPVKIIDLKVNDRPFPLDTVIHQKKSLVLPYDQNNLAFEFAALNSAVPALNRYTYRLVGGADKWVDLGHENKINLINLSPGHYTLQVKAANNDGVWSTEFATLSIVIRPPWWLSMPAFIAYFLGLILLTLGIVRWRTYRLNLQKWVLEKTVADRTAQVVAEKERSDALLLNILPKETAEELKLHGHAKAKHYEMVTVLFTDFKDFTQYSERHSPEELVQQIDYCYKAFDHIMEQHGIEKIKTIGDSYMAAGGLPKPNLSNPKDAVQAAIAIRDFMRDYQREREAQGLSTLHVRIGLHTGPVVAGIVGTKKFAYDIWGDTVNTASRIEQNCEIGKINISQSTFEHLQDDPAFSFVKREKIQVKGKDDLEMYFVELSSKVLK
ncbi:MAG: hypothetical protein EP344_03940 [Bacteroidetes bacterium]|nr:MAG: hypothetical protein EP344_03940 [Bacteroidota bacterium]